MRVSLVIVLAAAAAAQAAIPTFPSSYTVVERDAIGIHQGDYVTKGSQTCCVAGGNCKIQFQEQAGTTYADATRKQVLFSPFGTDESILTDYNTQKQYAIVNNTCSEYCPNQGEDKFPVFGPGPNTTAEGTVVVNGKTLNKYVWKTTILGIVTMETSTMLVDESGSAPVPVQETDVLTPFGEQIGSEETQWSNWQPGTPEPSVFTSIKGLASCKEGKKCNSNNSQQVRARMGLWNTYALYASQAQN